MKKIILTAFVLMLIMLTFTINIYAAEERVTVEYKTGTQIELYLKSDSSCELTSFADGGYVSFTIGDESVASVKNGKLIAKKEGLTYISFNYGNYIVNYNIIVHPGYKSVQYVKIDGKSMSSSDTATITLYIGKTYDLLINNDKDFDFSSLKIRAYTSMGEVPASEFISIDNKGKLTVVGQGACDLVVKLSTNRSDVGLTIKIKTDFNNSELRDAALAYLNKNGYELCAENCITASELSLVDTLRLTALKNYSNENLGEIFPKLKTVVFDFSNAKNTSLGSLTINDDKFDYQFIGNSEKTYSFKIDSQNRDELKINFVNFNYRSSEVALNLEGVSNSVVSFNGKCSIEVNQASENSNGYAAIVASSLDIQLSKEAKVTICGGDGGLGKVYGGISGKGGIAIKTTKLNIIANGYSESTLLEIYGGDGGNGNEYGNSGGDGNCGISTEMLSIQGIFSCRVYGGNGGDGKAGKDDYTCAPVIVGSANPGKDGKQGNTGKTGQSGGNGGNGAVAVSTMSIDKAIGLELVLVGGNGGDGAKGGRGQDGGTGGKGGRTSGNEKGTDDAGDGGRGGQGGQGGNGGDAGYGSLAIYIFDTEYLNSLKNTSMIHGYSGNAGSGGRGGDGGDGGQGGDDKNSNGFLGEGPVHGLGGRPGSGGNGGGIGNSATEVQILGLSNINETIAKKTSVTTPTKGNKGNSGSWGSDGNHGDVG